MDVVPKRYKNSTTGLPGAPYVKQEEI